MQVSEEQIEAVAKAIKDNWGSNFTAIAIAAIQAAASVRPDSEKPKPPPKPITRLASVAPFSPALEPGMRKLVSRWRFTIW